MNMMLLLSCFTMFAQSNPPIPTPTKAGYNQQEREEPDSRKANAPSNPSSLPSISTHQVDDDAQNPSNKPPGDVPETVGGERRSGSFYATS